MSGHKGFRPTHVLMDEIAVWEDPTYGRIDRDIQEAVDAMHPQDVGQRVALENTLQLRRDKDTWVCPHEVVLSEQDLTFGYCQDCGVQMDRVRPPAFDTVQQAQAWLECASKWRQAVSPVYLDDVGANDNRFDVGF